MTPTRAEVERVATWLDSLAAGWRELSPANRYKILDTHVDGAANAATMLRALLARAETAEADNLERHRECGRLRREAIALRARLTALAARWEHYGDNTASHDAGYKDAAREIAAELRAILEASHE